MTLQEVTGTIRDGSLGVLPAQTTGIPLIFGYCSGLAVNTMTPVNDTESLAALGYGPAAQQAAIDLAISGGPVYVLNPTTSTAGANTAVTATGTSPPTVSVAGTPTDAFDFKMLITLGGAVGTAKFKYSLDGGTTYSAELVTASSYPIPNTGLTLTIGAGTYVTDNVFVFTSTPPHYTTTNMNTGIDVALADLREFGHVHFVGQAPGADDAAKVTAFVAMFSAVATKMATALSTHKKPIRAVLEAPDVADAALLVAAVAALGDTRCAVIAGFGRTNSSLAVVGLGTPYVSLARVVMSEIPGKALGKDPSQVLDEPGTGALPAALVSIGRDERKTPGLDAARFTTVRTYMGKTGFYVTNFNLFSALGSDWKYIQHGQIADTLYKVIRGRLLTYLSRDLDVKDDGSGQLDKGQAESIDEDVNGDCKAAVTGHVSGVQYQTNQTDNVLSTERLRGSCRFVPKFYPKSIEFDIAMTRSLAAA